MNPFGDLHWFAVEKCLLCNGTGKIIVCNEVSPDEEECPICEGKGELKVFIQ